MVTIRSANEIILSLIDFLRVKQPLLDTKPGTVSRDLFVEAPASQLSLLYDEISKVSDLQSLRLSVGSDLDNYAQNFAIVRKAATKSSGVALLTFASIPTTIAINKNAIITASNGVTFSVLNGVAVNPTALNSYRAVATRYRSDLDFLGITDQYAVEVAVVATTAGVVGNLSKFGLTRTNIAGVSNVTNVFPFSGGSNQEDDDSFRNRILAVFSGSNVGTALGYKNTVLTDSSVIDALVIEPGDPLMTRDGTQVIQNPDRSYSVISEGQGGKVDIIILGTRVAEYIDTFIYRDASNTNDPTDEKNVFTLGQITGDENKTVNRKRLDNLKSGILPAQPVQEIVEVTGSLSGSNFKPKSVDALGRVTGNYELIKDTGVYAGSPWSFDQFRWVSDRISEFPEDKIKGRYNGQDNTAFTDVLNISANQQNISIQNENSTLAQKFAVDGSVETDAAGNAILDPATIQLNHTPATNVTRVFNLTTGERYTVSNQNPAGTGTTNTTGRVSITGNTLPSPSDTLQVDYTWIVDYDPYIDYDGRYLNNNPRTVQDSIDWGYSNAVRNEVITFTKNTASTYYEGSVIHPISSVINAKTFSARTSTVTAGTGVYVGRLAVVVDLLLEAPTTIDSVKLLNTSKEVFVTGESDGIFFSEKVVVGGLLRYTCTIILPTDTVATLGNNVNVIFDEEDVYTISGVSGNFTSNQITIPVSNVSGAPASFSGRVNYIANVVNFLSVNLTDIPLIRGGNGYIRSSLANTKLNDPSLTLRKDFVTVTKTGTAAATFKIPISSQEYVLNASKIVAAVRITDGVKFEVNSVTVDTDNQYLVSLTATNSPANNDNVLVFFFADDIVRTQPMTFATTIIGNQVSTTVLDLQGEISLSGLTFPANISASKIAVFRLSDGLEISDRTSVIDTAAGTLKFPPAYEALLTGGEKVIVIYYGTEGLRQSFSRLAATLSDQIANEGILTVSGTTATKAADIVFTAINSGFTQNVSEAVRKAKGLLSNEALPSGIQLVRVVKLEKVSVTDGEVVTIDASYDVLGTRVKNSNFFSNEMVEDLNLSDLDFTIPSTVENTTDAPNIGDQLRITFYYVTPNDTEDLVFSRNGTVYGNKFFAIIDKAYVSSGFNTVSTGKITFAPTNQPITGSRYRTFYDYLAPKPNERIIIRYNYNKLISDATLTLEPTRPISADVLLKEAVQLKVNLSLAIVVKSEFTASTNVVLQNVKDRVTAAINTNTLGDTLDSSDLSSVAQGVTGVDRVRVTAFNLDQEVGQVLSIIAQKNEYFVANTITIVAEGR